MKGIYTIIMVLKEDVRLKVGRLGVFRLSKGLCAYSGSARGDGASSIERRIERHMGSRHRNFWHIDYLLSLDCCEIEAIVYSETVRDLECEVNNRIRELAGAASPIKGFGSSDCACISHLLHFPRQRIDRALAMVRSVHAGLRLKPKLFRPARSA